MPNFIKAACIALKNLLRITHYLKREKTFLDNYIKILEMQLWQVEKRYALKLQV